MNFLQTACIHSDLTDEMKEEASLGVRSLVVEFAQGDARRIGFEGMAQMVWCEGEVDFLAIEKEG